MKPTIAIVDYGMGNLRSVSKALEKAGARVLVTDSPNSVRAAQGIVLPGVGAFGEASRRLTKSGLARVLESAIAEQKPFLGICLGLQLLFDRSEEAPGERGLGLFAGEVRRFRVPKASRMKVPHMGWNTLKANKSNKRKELKELKVNSFFYFVHSFYPAPKDKSVIAATTDYGTPFCSAAARGSVFATQFHPEKSGAEGQKILRQFAREVAQCS